MEAQLASLWLQFAGYTTSLVPILANDGRRLKIRLLTKSKSYTLNRLEVLFACLTISEQIVHWDIPTFSDLIKYCQTALLWRLPSEPKKSQKKRQSKNSFPPRNLSLSTLIPSKIKNLSSYKASQRVFMLSCKIDTWMDCE